MSPAAAVGDRMRTSEEGSFLRSARPGAPPSGAEGLQRLLSVPSLLLGHGAAGLGTAQQALFCKQISLLIDQLTGRLLFLDTECHPYPGWTFTPASLQPRAAVFRLEDALLSKMKNHSTNHAFIFQAPSA